MFDSGTCSTRHRLGPARSASFAAVSAGTPLLAHPAEPLPVILALLVLTATFALWTWARACSRPRSMAYVFGAIVVAQLATHVTYTYTALLATRSASHVHMHHQGAADSAVANATSPLHMVLVHLLAALLGAAVIAFLDRRVVAVAASLVRRVHRALCRAAISARIRPSCAARPRPIRSAVDAIARAARLTARTHARRGPPCVAVTPA